MHVNLDFNAKMVLEQLSERDRATIARAIGLLAGKSYPTPSPQIQMLAAARTRTGDRILSVRAGRNWRVLFTFSENVATVIDILRQDQFERLQSKFRKY